MHKGERITREGLPGREDDSGAPSLSAPVGAAKPERGMDRGKRRVAWNQGTDLALLYLFRPVDLPTAMIRPERAHQQYPMEIL